MKYLLAFSLLLNILLFVKPAEEDKRFRIAIVTPVSHPSLEQIEKGFVDTLPRDIFSFKTYNAQGNKSLMHAEIEEIARQNYDLVFAIGSASAKMAKELFERKALSTPIVYAAVFDPVRLQLDKLTGVFEVVDYERQLRFLKYFKPNVQKILLVYDPTQPCGSNEEILKLQEIADRLSLQLKKVEVFKTNEMLIKVSPHISEAEALLVLKDNTVVPGLDLLVKLCKQQGIPLVATDLDSVDRGAAFAFGVFEYDFGVEAAKKALKLLTEGQAPPSTPLNNFKLLVNPEAL